MHLSADTKLGAYEILAAIGAGGMGEVYRARDTKLGREVAIKVLPASLTTDPDRLRRFELEARTAGALNHPNILAIYDLGTHNGAPFLVSELLEGETLRARLAEGPPPLRKALDYAVQIANGLAAAHEKGIVHRDLKPDNLFVTKGGRIKILDFGLAKLADPQLSEKPGETAPTLTAPDAPQTHPGAVLGTVGYMSPEQVRGKPADHRSDIFSFGATLYEMVSGQRPFRGNSSVETMNAILKEDPPEISATNRNVPPALDRLIRRCLEKSPDERFQSAHDLAFALDALSALSSSGTAQAALAAERSAKNWLRPLAAAALVVAIGVASFFAGLRTGRGSQASSASFKRLSFHTEKISKARFAPDGRTIVFSAALEGNVPELFMIRSEYPEPQPLGLRDVHLLAISSRGDLALITNARFIAHSLFSGTLAVMPLGGGAPREILEHVREAAWAPDGSSLAVIRDENGKDHLEYPVGKVLYETAGYLSDLCFSPKGDQIAFFDHPLRYDDRGAVDVVDLAGKRKVLSDGYQAEEGIAWTPDGNEVVFSATMGESEGLIVYAVDLRGRRRVALQGAGNTTIQDISSQGRWLITRDEEFARVRAAIPGITPERDFSWLNWSSFPVLSKDRRTLLFSEEGEAAGKNYTVCLRRTDGSPVVRLGEGSALDLSPDGKQALVAVYTSPPQLLLYPTGPGELRRLERGGLENYQAGRWFLDGKRVLVCGNEPGHAARCYVQNVDGGNPRAVTPEGTSWGIISPDGKTILTRSGSKFLLTPVEGGPPQEIPWLKSDERVIRFTPDGRSVLAFRPNEVPTRVERVDLTTGRRQLVKELGPPERAGVQAIASVFIADDEKSYAYSSRGSLSELYLVVGAR